MNYRKKPVIIEARQLDTQNGRDLAEWCGGRLVMSASRWHILITTLEGVMDANEGDWIIKGVKGEFYPCKPDIFKATYEVV